MRPEEAGQIFGPSSEPAGAGGSTAAPEVLVKGGGPTAAPEEPAGADGSSTKPEVPVERGGFATAPSEKREMSPSAQEQGAGLNWPRPDELEQESGGSSPKRSFRRTATA